MTGILYTRQLKLAILTSTALLVRHPVTFSLFDFDSKPYMPCTCNNIGKGNISNCKYRF